MIDTILDREAIPAFQGRIRKTPVELHQLEQAVEIRFAVRTMRQMRTKTPVDSSVQQSVKVLGYVARSFSACDRSRELHLDPRTGE